MIAHDPHLQTVSNNLMALSEVQEAFSVPSDVLRVNRHMPSSATSLSNIRQFYVHSARQESASSPVVIASSPWVPRNLVRHLMYAKRDSALATKYVRNSAISNIQGALHSFVTALVPIKMHGDYVYRGGHSIRAFELSDLLLGTGRQASFPATTTTSSSSSSTAPPAIDTQGISAIQLYRPVVLSTMIHLDFENAEVANRLFAVREGLEISKTFPPAPFPEAIDIPTPETLNDRSYREKYDDELISRAIWHLTKEHRMPFPGTPDYFEFGELGLLRYLDEKLSSSQPYTHQHQDAFLVNKVLLPSHPQAKALSLEMMHNALVESLTNEWRALETLCTRRGYVFTWNPPSIFAMLVESETLNRLFVHAVRAVLNTCLDPHSLHSQSNAMRGSHFHLEHLRCFVFDDFKDKVAMQQLRSVFEAYNLAAKRNLSSHNDVLCRARREAFDQHAGDYVGNRFAPGCTLVLHNNSDAFGANIETEGPTSLDGVIGCYSSAAAALNRNRADLVSIFV